MLPDPTERVDGLDVTLFRRVPTQSGPWAQRGLLAVQRATACKHGGYAYLEIGSHLGGSLVPHLLDDRCSRVYSVDPRPESQPDDRSPGWVAAYPGNSTGRMLGHLRRLGDADLGKLTCFEQRSRDVPPGALVPRPRIAFIDGEHTRQAVLDDCDLCRGVLARGGTILFHDYSTVRPGIEEIQARLQRDGVPHAGARLEGSLYGLFFDLDLAPSDPYLAGYVS